MSAGTLTLTNNSASVAGNGTAFTTEVAGGDFIVVTVGGIPYTLPVKSVESGAALTLVSNFTGPTQAGAAWSAVPRIAMNLVTAALVAQSAEALRGLNYDKQNWQSIFSGTGTATVRLPDGSSFTGPTWLKIKKLLEESDIEAIKPIAAQVSADAKQVAADKNTASNAATTAANKANEASTSASSANTAKTAAESARTTAQQAATNASGSAANARNDADRAKAAADSIDTTVLEQKINGKADKVDGAVPINQGGTGSTDASGARTSLGLGTAATRDTGTSPGQVLLAGAAFGLGGNLAGYSYSHPTGFYTGQPDAPTPGYGGGCVRMSSGNYQSEWFSPLAGQVRLFARNINSISGGSAWAEFYSTHNTTKAADGTLKAASPVVKIFHDGNSETNDESEGCAVTRVSVGVYLVEGCVGLNSDAGWGGIDGGFDIPKDRNRQPLIWLDYEVNADGSVLVKTYHRTYPDAPAFARNERPGLNDGDPVDIPADQFVSVRVEMPRDSIWHQKQKEMREVMEDAERGRQQNQQNTQS